MGIAFQECGDRGFIFSHESCKYGLGILGSYTWVSPIALCETNLG